MVTYVPILLALVGLLVSDLATSIKVSKCKQSKAPKPSENDVEIIGCSEIPCRMRRKSEMSIHMKVKPEKDIDVLTTNVHAIIAGVPLPFIGVDGTSACNFLYEADGKTKASCPLIAGKEYLYKNSFKILEIYPKIKLTVNWALTDRRTKEDLACFELPSSITN